MTDVVITDRDLAATFQRAGTPLAVCAADGRRLGVFTPDPPPARPPEPKITEEEMNRRLTDPNTKWYTAAEVEAKMREWARA